MNREPIVIPSGLYQGVCLKQEKFIQFGGKPKLCLEWEIDFGDYGSPVILPQYFNLNHKTFKDSTAYYCAWVIANNNQRPAKRRLAYMSPKIFVGIEAELMIEIVIPTFKNGDEKPEVFHYSKVSEMIGLVAQNPKGAVICF